MESALPNNLYFAISYRAKGETQFIVDNKVYQTINEMMYLIYTKHRHLITGTLDNMGETINEALQTIKKHSNSTSMLQSEQILEVKEAVQKYNNCFPRYAFLIKEPGDGLPQFHRTNAVGKDIIYNELYANFVSTGDFTDLQKGLLPKLIMYCVSQDIPGLGEFSKRIVGISTQRTLVAQTDKKRIDYRFFNEGYCLRLWFDEKITEEEMTQITLLFRTKFMVAYAADKKVRPDVQLRSCGFFK